jgi:hypothetical protein
LEKYLVMVITSWLLPFLGPLVFVLLLFAIDPCFIHVLTRFVPSCLQDIKLQMMSQCGFYPLLPDPPVPLNSLDQASLTILSWFSVRPCHVPMGCSIILCQNNKYIGRDISTILSSSKQLQVRHSPH